MPCVFTQPSSPETSFVKTKSKEVTIESSGAQGTLEHSVTESFGHQKQRSFALRSQYTVSNLMGLGRLGQVGDREKFRDEVAVVRQRLKSVNRRVINPRSRKLAVWDSAMICALMWTAFVTPFEVSFFVTEDGGFDSGPVNFALNRMVDALFTVDIVIHFYLPYRAKHSDGGMMVYDNWKIVKHYLRGWFAIDVITCIPLDLIVSSIASASATTIDAASFRLLRMLRILKLARIVRASRIFDRWQDHINLSFASMSLIRFSFLTIVLAHCASEHLTVVPSHRPLATPTPRLAIASARH